MQWIIDVRGTRLALFATLAAMVAATCLHLAFSSRAEADVTQSLPRTQKPFNTVLKLQSPIGAAQIPFSGRLPLQSACAHPQRPFPENRRFPVLSDLPVPQTFPNEFPLTPKEQLGKLIFFDTTLSDPRGQACASCHDHRTGFMGPSSRINREFAGIMPGAVHGRFGRRIPPSISYVRFTPKGPITRPFGEEQDDELLGGMMWDGRARSLMDIGAFLDPNEQANRVTQSNASPALRQDFSIVLARKIPGRPYSALFRSVFGGNAFVGMGNPMDLVTLSTEERVFTHVMEALSAYISSVEVNPFSSKWDAVQRGRAQFTDSERRGKNLFFGEKAQCFKCHSSATEPALAGVRTATKNRNVFTSFVFFNTGVPKSRRNPTRAIDAGMAGNSFGSEDVPKVYYNDDEFRGKFKAPTLRNTTKGPPGFVKALTHGGFFTSLDELVLFYSERNVAVSARSDARGRVTKKVFDLRDGPPKGFLRQFPPPETLLNVYNVTGVGPGEGDGSDEANGQIGNLRLTKQERHDLVAFIRTLDDGFMRPDPGP